MKTSELTGAALDWAVAKALGAVHVQEGEYKGLLHWPSPKFGTEPCWSSTAPAFSTDPTFSWPIINREKIAVSPEGDTWIAVATLAQDTNAQYGPTSLIAAMRCYVASELGDEVEVPDGLV